MRSTGGLGKVLRTHLPAHLRFEVPESLPGLRSLVTSSYQDPRMGQSFGEESLASLSSAIEAVRYATEGSLVVRQFRSGSEELKVCR